MKKFFFVAIVLVLVSQGNVSAGVDISGRIETDNRIRIEQEGKLTWNEGIFSLKAESWLGVKIAAFSEIQLRAFGFPDVSDVEDLSQRDKTKVAPWSLELKEAYIDYYGFVFDKLDLRVGKQRIAWGTADKLNPTDNLNPDDFSDPMDFGKKLPTNSLKAAYYLNEFTTITNVFLPSFTPSVLPPSDWSTAPVLPLPTGMSIGNITDSITLPEHKIAKSMYAFKLASQIFGYDVSLSYFKGRDDMPIVKKITLRPVDAATVDVHMDMIYPKLQVIGYDIAGSISDVGIWGEIGYFIPETIEQEVIFEMETSKEKVLGDPYVKYTIGGDYTFKNGIYLNAQLCHGFFDERGKNLTNLLMVSIEKKFLYDRLKLTLASGAEVNLEGDSIMPSSVIFPEVAYYPADATEIQLGCYFINGTKDSKFGPFGKNDELYLKFKYSF